MKTSTHEQLRKNPFLAVLVQKSVPEGEVLGAGRKTANAQARHKKIVADHAAGCTSCSWMYS